MLITDPILVSWIATNMPWMHIHLPVIGEISWAQILGAALVILAGKIMATRAARTHAVDLAADEQKTKSS
jgi:hypothetical protein